MSLRLRSLQLHVTCSCHQEMGFLKPPLMTPNCAISRGGRLHVRRSQPVGPGAGFAEHTFSRFGAYCSTRAPGLGLLLGSVDGAIVPIGVVATAFFFAFVLKATPEVVVGVLVIGGVTAFLETKSGK